MSVISELIRIVADPRIYRRVVYHGWWRGVMTALVCMYASFAPLILPSQTVVPIPDIPADFSTPPAFDLQHIRSVQACYATVRFVSDSIRKYWRNDTLYYDEDRQIPAAVVTTARQCLERFPVSSLDTLELPTVLEVALLTGDTVPVSNVLNRLLTIRPAVRERIDAIFDILGKVKRIMHPVPLPFTRNLVARLDSFGPDARREQAEGRLLIANFYRHRGASPDTMIPLIQEALAAYQQISLATLTPFLAEMVTRGIGELKQDVAWYTYLRDGTQGRFQEWVEVTTNSGESGLLGRMAPAIEGEFWINRAVGDGMGQPKALASGQVPFPGSITIVTGINAEARRDMQPWDLIKRIHQRFPSVKIILLAQTAGAVWNKIRVDDPSKEADILGQFYLDSLRLPAWLNVSKSLIDTTLLDAQKSPAIFSSKTYEAWGYGGSNDGFYVLDHRGYVVKRMYGTADIKEFYYTLEKLIRLAELSSSATKK